MIKKEIRSNQRDNKNKLIIKKSYHEIVFLFGKEVMITVEGKDALRSYESYMELAGEKFKPNRAVFRVGFLLEAISRMKKAGFNITTQKPPEPSIWARPSVMLLNFGFNVKEKELNSY
jgi:hypothetical protein